MKKHLKLKAMKKYYLIIIVLLNISTKKSYSQDPEFTQFYANPLYLNPAFAGTNNCPRLTLNYRNQWPSLSGTYVTNSISYDQEINNLGGVGLLITHDVAAKTISTFNVSGIYAKAIPLTRILSLRVGFQATFFQKTLDWSKLTFGDMIHSRRGFVHQTKEITRGGKKIGVDFSGGVLLYSETFYAGIAAHHLNEPQESLILSDKSKLPLKLTGHIGAMLDLPGNKYSSDIVKVSPNLLFRQQGTFQQLNLGMYIIKSAFWGGVWYRNSDSFIILAGVKSNTFKLGYSYDVTTSKLTLASGGSHEISLGIKFPCKPTRIRYRTISCPSFN
jgi:type IX secretion system PorP/SprF family membrane protein